MFRFNLRSAGTAPGTDRSQRLFKRALLCGTGLILLWLALQFVPSSGPAAVYADEAGTVAANPSGVPERRDSFSFGHVAAVLLLMGGAGFAIYLKRRNGGADVSSIFRSLGSYQLAPNQQLRLIACGDDVLLLGVSSGQITLLKRYPTEHFDLRETSGDGAAGPPGHHFASVLQQYAGLGSPAQSNASPC